MPCSSFFVRFMRIGCAYLLVAGCLVYAAAAATDTTATKPAAKTADTHRVVASPQDRPLTPLTIIGSLAKVNAGKVSPWDLPTVDLSTMTAGFGYGSAGPFYATGNMFSFCGRTFIRATDPKTGVHVVEVTAPFTSPFALTLGNPTVMNTHIFPRVFRLNTAEPILLYTYLENLAKQTKSPIGVLGWAEMPDVEGLALKRAPIDGESLAGSKKDDYVETLHAQTAHVVYFAVVVPQWNTLGRASRNARALSKVAFDYAPDEGQVTPTALINVHAALVNEEAPSDFDTSPILINRLRAVTVKDIMHLQGSTTIQRGEVMIYQLQYMN